MARDVISVACPNCGTPIAISGRQLKINPAFQVGCAECGKILIAGRIVDQKREEQVVIGEGSGNEKET